MPKASKSSASGGTRKKHAKKADKGGDGDDEDNHQQSRQRGQKKMSKAQRKALPKVKQYIPPPKPPAPPILDPLDGQGLARTLPAELVVVLRRLGKKDDVTRRKGLDELREGWVAKVLRSANGEEEVLEKEAKETALLSAAPVWLHNLASLLQSPSHRTIALQTHAELLSISSVGDAIIETFSLSLLPGTQNRDILGSWLVAALEEGRRAGGIGLKSWEQSTIWTASRDGEAFSNAGEKIDIVPQLPSLIEYLSLSIVRPPALHDDIYPAPVIAMSTPKAKGSISGKARAPTPHTPPALPAPAEEEEVIEERWARYRVGGLTALTWLVGQYRRIDGLLLSAELLILLSSTFLWSGMANETPADSSEQAPGSKQPAVRKATYALLSSLLDLFPEVIEEPRMLELLSVSVLQNCWLERDPGVWAVASPTVAKFLSKFRTSWQIAVDVTSSVSPAASASVLPVSAASVESGESDKEDDNSDISIGEERDPFAGEPASNSRALSAGSIGFPVFANFLDFVATICPTIPDIAYPLLLVVISSLPSTLLPLEAAEPSLALSTFFAHLWSPVDARLLSTHAVMGRLSAFQTFLQHALDCVVFLVGKSFKSENGELTARWIASHQLARRAWSDGVLAEAGHGIVSRAQPSAVVERGAAMFGRALRRLVSVDQDLALTVVEETRESLLQASFTPESDQNSEKRRVRLMLRSFGVVNSVRAEVANEAVGKLLDDTFKELAERYAAELELAVKQERDYGSTLAEHMTCALAEQRNLISDEVPQRVSAYLERNMGQAAKVLGSRPLVLLIGTLATLFQRDTLRGAFWRLIDSNQAQPESRFALALAVLTTKNRAVWELGSFDNIAEEAAETALDSDSSPAKALVIACLQTGSALGHHAEHTVLALTVTAINNLVDAIIDGNHDLISSEVPKTALELFAAYAVDHLENLVQSDIALSAMIAIHHLVILLPRSTQETFSPPSIANEIWSQITMLSGADRQILQARINRELNRLLADVDCRIDPTVLVDISLVPTVMISRPAAVDVLVRLLPQSSTMLDQIDRCGALPPNVTLPIVDPLIPCETEEISSVFPPPQYDSQGRSQSARYAEAIMALLRADRHIVRDHPSTLRIILSVRAFAQDALAVPGSSRIVFRQDTDPALLEEIIREAEGALSYALAEMDDTRLEWHQNTVQLLTRPTPNGLDFLQRLLLSLMSDLTDVSARIFRDVLSRHLRQSGAGHEEAEVWLSFAVTPGDKNPQLAMAVLMAVKPLLLDTEVMAKAQNRIASRLTEISTKEANMRGIPALRLLVTCAPPLDSTSVFLPQQRAIFVLRHVSEWLTSDDADDLTDEVGLRVAELYTLLAPIVQDVTGKHWDSIFDLIESSLESSSLSDRHTYCLLHQSLLLLHQVRDLSSTNKSLRALWSGKDTHFGLVLGLFLQIKDADTLPLQMIQDLLLDLLQDVSEEIVGDRGLSDLCRLLKLPTSDVVKTTAYRFMNQVIRRRTLALVLEVEASVFDLEEGQMHQKIRLPSDLVDVIADTGVTDWLEASVKTLLGQLLAWMAILDHFDDASRTLRWAYLDQLNSLQLISGGLLPMLFAMLGVSEVGAWNFPASQFAVDEFFPEFMQPEELADLTPLASHVYYRALVTIPSSMRIYYEGLKDRQLSMSMLNFTARYYSPVIIQLEFSAIREPQAMAQLTEEGLNVRIAQGGGATVALGSGSAEAIASYVVDEQPMEIGIRLPAEFPLKGVDVRDLKRVGVPENKWRGWLMSVQQTITSRNGLILEALTVFKKNVTLHFEGVVECAICYSIISLTDRSLPTKPCRTCKNRFHASCLFKWFNSSHTSSCPLCRALF